MMDLRHLRYFLAVAQEEHFGRAAQRLHIVQPALSMQIKALEEELGAPLFVRTSRKVRLTEVGELLRVEAERTLLQAERTKSIIAKAARGESGSVRIGFAGNAALVGKMSIDLESFHSQFPDVEIDLQETHASAQADAIVRGTLDLGYRPGFGDQFSDELEVVQVGVWPWMIALSDKHPLAAKLNVRMRDLSGQRFILYAHSGADQAQLRILRSMLGEDPEISHRVANTLSVLALAAAGLGLALVPASLKVIRIPGIEYRPLKGALQSSDLVLIHRRVESSPAIQAYLRIAKPGSKA